MARVLAFVFLVVAVAYLMAPDTLAQESISHRTIPAAVASLAAFQEQLDQMMAEETRVRDLIRSTRDSSRAEPFKFSPRPDVDDSNSLRGEPTLRDLIDLVQRLKVLEFGREVERESADGSTMSEQVSKVPTRGQPSSENALASPTGSSNDVPTGQRTTSVTQAEGEPASTTSGIAAKDTPDFSGASASVREGLRPSRLPRETDTPSLSDSLQIERRVKDQTDQWRQQLRTIRQQRLSLQKSLRRAAELPQSEDGFVPHQDWLSAVRPFINASMVRELYDAYRNSSVEQSIQQQTDRDPTVIPPRLTTTPKRARLSELTANTGRIENATPENMRTPADLVGRLIKSVDKQGTDWLRSSQEERERGIKRAGQIWKSLKNTSLAQARGLRQSLREYSPSREDSPAVIFGPLGRGGSRLVSNSVVIYRVWLPLALAVACVAWLASRWYRAKNRDVRFRVSSQCASFDIQDRDSLLQACHDLSRNVCGAPSLYWHHRKVFDYLAKATGQTQAASSLAEIYEIARYAQHRSLAPNRLEMAKHLVYSLNENVRTASKGTR